MLTGAGLLQMMTRNHYHLDGYGFRYSAFHEPCTEQGRFHRQWDDVLADARPA